jgi:hypothetical protein
MLDDKCDVCNCSREDLIHHAAKLAELGREKAIEVSDFNCHEFQPKTAHTNGGRLTFTAINAIGMKSPGS